MKHLPRRLKLITLAMALALGSFAVSAAATSAAHAHAFPPDPVMHTLSMMRSAPPDPMMRSAPPDPHVRLRKSCESDHDRTQAAGTVQP
jgi:hypothetical protein